MKKVSRIIDIFMAIVFLCLSCSYFYEPEDSFIEISSHSAGFLMLMLFAAYLVRAIFGGKGRNKCSIKNQT